MPSLFDNATTKNNESSEEKQNVDFHNPEEYKPMLSSLGNKLKSSIDRFCAVSYAEPPRWYLGASIIGHSCKRYLWYSFRWCKFEKFDGRQSRLLDRGNKEEARFIEWLKGIGCKVWDKDPDTGKQYKFSSIMGHFGGSLDSIVEMPTEWGFAEPLLAEFKTNNTGKGFNSLLSEGVQKAKFLHWAQDCTYGYMYNLPYLAYFNINKNDDDLYVETVKLDFKLGKQMEEKAQIIICSQTPPAKLSDNPNHYECNYCAMKEICHNNEATERNCRSCKFAEPRSEAEWHCNKHGGTMPREFVKSLQGCDFWQSIARIE